MILTGTGTVQSEFLPPLVDAVSGTISACFSLRKLRAAYSGSAIRVRRSSDNTQSDIGFDSFGDLDTSALTSFVGAGNGRITVWYDQSGNGRNLQNAVTTTQPVIVDSGSILTYNNRPTISFNNYGLVGTSQWFAAGDLYASCVLKSNAISTSRGLLSSRNTGFDNSPAMTLANGNAPSIASSFGGCGAFSDANQMIFSAQLDAAVSSYLWKNSVLQSGPCANGTYTNLGTNTVMGAPRFGEAYNLNAYVFELCVWSTLQADNTQSTIIEANQAKYYSVQF